MVIGCRYLSKRIFTCYYPQIVLPVSNSTSIHWIKEECRSLTAHLGNRVISAVSGWSELPRILSEWISDVSLPVSNWSFLSRQGLDIESKHGEHRKTTVLDLLHLEFSKGIRIVSQTKGVKEVTCTSSEKTHHLSTGQLSAT